MDTIKNAAAAVQEKAAEIFNSVKEGSTDVVGSAKKTLKEVEQGLEEHKAHLPEDAAQKIQALVAELRTKLEAAPPDVGEVKEAVDRLKKESGDAFDQAKLKAKEASAPQ